MGLTEQKRCLKSVFLTHRQMGISEAFMKILPEMRLKDSTIGTEFLPLGKREDISRFVVRADDKIAGHMKLFEIPGREGLYFEKPNWIEKYFRIGDVAKVICPSHLVKMYDPSRTSKGNVETKDDYVEDDDNNNNEENSEKYEKNEKFHHVITSKGVSDKLLPDVIELDFTYPGEPRFLRKRKHPKALRFYKARQEKNRTEKENEEPVSGNSLGRLAPLARISTVGERIYHLDS